MRAREFGGKAGEVNGKQLTYGSLFAGIGGFDLGFDRAGMRCVWQVELNEFCRKVLAKHWPGVPKWDDVRTFTGDGFERPDIICGGDPCQGNSNAGSVHKSAHADIGAEFVRVVDLFRPRVVVRENPSRSRPDAVRPWQRMRSDLEHLGYVVLPFRLRACCLGADHERERLFLLATLPDAHGERLEGEHGRRESVRDAGGTTGHPVRPAGRYVLPPPRVCRSGSRVPHLVDRLRGLGNAVDPRVSEFIGRQLVAAWDS